MKHLRISAMAAMAAVLSLALTIPALAAGPFSDVPAGTALYDSVMYLADRGITAGTGEGRFSPAQPMTVNQWAVMLCRAYGGSDWWEESRSGVAAAYQKGWVRESAVLYPDTRLCRGALYEYGFAAAGIPVYDASLYPGGQALSPYENLMRIGRQLGLWPEGAGPLRHCGPRGGLLFSLRAAGPFLHCDGPACTGEAGKSGRGQHQRLPSGTAPDTGTYTGCIQCRRLEMFH